MKLIYDCDNTTGIHGRDIDDGLTLLYLYKNENIDLLGNTLTFGNGTVEEVSRQSLKMKELFSLNIEMYTGREKGEINTDSKPSKAAEFLIDMVKKYPHQITILATGSMNNLYEASLFYPEFYDYVKEIAIMGGIFEPLKINGIPIGELNLSISNKASASVLNSEAKILLASGQYIVDGILSRSDIQNQLVDSKSSTHKWFLGAIMDWMDVNVDMWKLDGTINWDGITAFGLFNPEHFVYKDVYINADAKDLETGMIKISDVPNKNKIRLVYQIKDLPVLNSKLIKTLNSYFK